MSFPLMIQGSGDPLGTVQLQARSKTGKPGAPSPSHNRELLDSSQLRELSDSYLDICQSLGLKRTSKGVISNIGLTDGGMLAVVDSRSGSASIPIQLTQPGVLGINEDARKRVLEEALLHVTNVLLAEQHSLGWDQFCDERGLPDSIHWFAFHNAAILLGMLQRFLNQEQELQIQMRLAYETIEQRHDGQLFADMLREMQTEGCKEVPPQFVGRIIALLHMTPGMFPEFFEQTLLNQALCQFRLKNGRLCEDATAITSWVIEEHAPSRNFCQVLWPRHTEPMVRVGRLLRRLDAKETKTSDLLRQVASITDSRCLDLLLVAHHNGTPLRGMCSLVENYIREIVRTPALGVDIIRRLSRAAIEFAVQDSNIRARDMEGFRAFTALLEEEQAVLAVLACRRLEEECSQQDSDRRRKEAAAARKRVEDERKSDRALQRFLIRLSSSGDELDALEKTLEDCLATRKDFSLDDARTAISRMMEKFADRPDIGGALMARLMTLASAGRTTSVIDRLLARKYSLLQEAPVDYSGCDSTELLEILCGVLTFSDDNVELDHDRSLTLLSQHAQLTLNTEKGILRGLLCHTSAPERLSSASASKVSKAMIALTKKANNGKPRPNMDLMDGHFRLGLLAATEGSAGVATEHFCNLVRRFFDTTIWKQVGAANALPSEDQNEFNKLNKEIQSNDLLLRRVRAAATYLEHQIGIAESELDSGVCPAVGRERLADLIRLLETGRTMKGRIQNYKALRRLPRVVKFGKQTLRLRELLPRDRSASWYRMSLLAHYFRGEPLGRLMGNPVVEFVPPGEQEPRQFVARVAVNDHVAARWSEIFGRLIPGLFEELERRKMDACRDRFVSRFLRGLRGYLKQNGKEGDDIFDSVEVRTLNIESGQQSLQLILSDYVPELRKYFPDSLFSQHPGQSGLLGVTQSDTIAMEQGSTELRRDIAADLRAARRYGVGSREQVEVEDRFERIRAHDAALAVLFQSCSHQTLIHGGRLTVAGIRSTLPTLFEPPVPTSSSEAGAPISMTLGQRIDVSWVTERCSWMPFLEVAILYKTFLKACGSEFSGWAFESGFTEEQSRTVAAVMSAGCERLLPDLQLLIKCGGCLFLAPATQSPSGGIEPARPIASITADASANTSSSELKPVRAGTSRLDTQRLKIRLAILPSQR